MLDLDNFFRSDNEFLIIGGPCSLESEEQASNILESSEELKVLRAGIFKMRTNPDAFQGLGFNGLNIIKNLKEKHNFQFITEVTDPRQIEKFEDIVDIYQVGSRNMYNYDLLKELNQYDKPVLFKRGFSATVKEWLSACEYMKDLGEEKIMLCERGIRTFETSTRNTLDINSVVYLKQNYNFKVIVDPSHGAGISSMVKPLCHVAMASGCDGLLVETHPSPKDALSDAGQQITPLELNEIRSELKQIAKFFNKVVV